MQRSHETHHIWPGLHAIESANNNIENGSRMLNLMVYYTATAAAHSTHAARTGITSVVGCFKASEWKIELKSVHNVNQCSICRNSDSDMMIIFYTFSISNFALFIGGYTMPFSLSESFKHSIFNFRRLSPAFLFASFVSCTARSLKN
jgi:hypothetical protein